MDFFQFEKSFVESNRDSLKKWHTFLDEHKNIRACDLNDTFIPFHGTPLFSQLTKQQKQDLGFGLIRLVAEAIVLFESILCYSWRKQRHGLFRQNKKALGKFCHEELLHGQGFRKILCSQPELEWPQKSIMLRRNRILRRAFIWIAKRYPLAMFIHGAKVENFTLHYSQLVMKHAAEDCPWRKLNELHYQDEVHHSLVGYEYYDYHVKRMPFMKRWLTLGFSLMFFLGVQAMFWLSASRLIHSSFPEASRVRRFILTAKLSQWILYIFPPFVQTRKQVKAFYRRRRFIHHRFLSFIHGGASRGH